MKKVIIIILVTVLTLTAGYVFADNSVNEVENAVGNSLPDGFKIKNPIGKTDQISINDMSVRYGIFNKDDINQPQYGFECDAVSSDRTLKFEVLYFDNAEDALKSFQNFLSYAEYLKGVYGSDHGKLSINQVKKDIENITCRILEYENDGSKFNSLSFIKDKYMTVITYNAEINDTVSKIVLSLNNNLNTTALKDAKKNDKTYLKVNVTPSCFSQNTDKVNIKVTLNNKDNYTGEKPIDYVKLYDADINKLIERKPAVDGEIEFAIKNENSKEKYKYTVVCGDFTKDIKIPVLNAKISLEYNKVTDIRYKGVVADGSQHIKVNLSITGMNKGVLTIVQPDVGKIKKDGIFQNRKIKNPDETVEFEYYPPEYIEGELKKDIVNGKEIFYKTVHLTFLYTPNEGRQLTLTALIKVYKPPVVLAAFSDGEENQMNALAEYLKENQNNLYRYKSNSSDNAFEIAAERFANYTKTLTESWNDSGIKILRLDIIAYGLGGLITRSYIHTNKLYTNNIRKLILVAVPNHGIRMEDLDRLPYWEGYGKTIKKQLRQESDFLTKLNQGEQFANHINNRIQYANISGYSGKPLFMEGDGIVPLASSYLNGVYNKTYWQMSHFENFSNNVSAILQSENVYNDISKLLKENIPYGTLQQVKYFISDIKGDVEYNGLATEDIKTPFLISSNTVKTGNGKAILQVYVNSVLVSEIFLDKNSAFKPGGVTLETIYGDVKYGNVYIKNSSKSLRSIVFLKSDSSTYKVSMQNSDCLINLTKDSQTVSCYKGASLLSLHEPDATGKVTSVNENKKLAIGSLNSTTADTDVFFKDEFYKRTFSDKLSVWKFYFTDTVKELIKQIKKTEDVENLIKYNRRLLTPVIVAIIAIALFFALLSYRKIRVGVILIMLIVAVVIVVPKLL